VVISGTQKLLAARERSEHMTVLHRIGVAITDLAWYAAACAILAALIYATEGSQIVSDGGLSLGKIVGVYAAVAIVSGVILGILRPIAKGVLSTSLVSIPVALPSAMTILWFAEDRQMSRLTPVDCVIAIVIAVVGGPLIAAYVRLRKAKETERS
jgi:hypothetical protein